MNEDRWRRIEELYHAARLLKDSARASFLAAATEGDEELRHEVESLIVRLCRHLSPLSGEHRGQLNCQTENVAAAVLCPQS